MKKHTLRLTQEIVEKAFEMACVIVGHTNANELFNQAGLNSEAVWEGKHRQALAIVSELIEGTIG